MKIFHIITAKYLPSTNHKPARIVIHSARWLTYRRLRELKDHSDSKQWKPFTQETPF